MIFRLEILVVLWLVWVARSAVSIRGVSGSGITVGGGVVGCPVVALVVAGFGPWTGFVAGAVDPG